MLTKLLVIDDNLDNLISIKALLKNLIKDSVIMTALSGHEGVAIAKRELPDTILLDIQMPDLDGFAVCEALKSDSNTRLIPIILLTAKYVDTQSKVKGLEIGADAFLSKPIDENELVAQVKAMLRIKRAEDLLMNENEKLSEVVDLRTDQLITNQSKLLTVVNAIGNPVFYCDKSSIITLVNKAFTQFINLPKDQIIGYSISKVLPKNLSQYYSPVEMASLYVSGSLTSETTIETENGVSRDVVFNRSVVKSNVGEIDGIVGTIVDITERKNHERELYEYKKAIESSKDLIALVDKDFNYVFVNESFAKYHDLPVDKIINQNVSEILPPEYFENELKPQLIQAFEGTPVSFESSNRFPHLGKRYFAIQYSPVVEPNGGIEQIIGIIRDITDKKIAEDALIENQQLLDETQQLAALGSWVWDLQAQTLEWSDEVYRIFGFKPRAFPASIEIFESAIHPDDREDFLRKRESMLNTYEETNIEHRIVLPDYTIKHVQERTQLIKDSNDQITRVIGSVQDITERVLAEEKLKRSESDLKKAQKLAHIGSWKWYIQSNILEWSDEMYAIFDVDKSDFNADLNEIIAQRIHPNDVEKVEKSNLSVIEAGEPVALEYRVVWQDKSIHYIYAEAGELLYDDLRKPLVLTGVAQDITDQRKKQHDIELNSKRLKSLVELSQLENEPLEIINEFTLAKAIELTDSKIGFLSFLNSDETIAHVQTWSIGIQENCRIANPSFDFVVGETGIWSDVVRKRKPIIINDYSVEIASRKGLPEGHVPITKYLSVPLFEQNKIVAIIAVGNKEEDYSDIDIQQLTLLLDGLWDTKKKLSYQQELIAAKEHAEESEKKVLRHLVELESLNIEITTLLDAAKTVLELENFEITARKLFNSCKLITGAQSGYVALLSESGEENQVLFLDSGGLDCTVDTNLPMPVRGLRAEAYKLHKTVFSNDFTNTEWYNYLPQGHVMLKNVLFAPLMIDKKTVGLIGLANKPTDFTARDVRIVTAFGELASIALNNSINKSELIKAKEKAEESDKLKSAFLANLSHEVRTPMNAIIGFAEMLNFADTPEKRTQFVDIIISSSNQLLSLITDIINVSRIDSGDIKPSIKPTHLNALIIEQYEIMLLSAQKKNIELLYETGLDKSNCMVETDAGLLKQILANILSNAIKFTEKGFVKFGYTIQNNSIVFFVTDTGIGISPEHHQAIFDRFRQVELDLNRKFGGAGLGLALSKGYVTLLGGDIRLESQPGVGTTFFICIPYRPVKQLQLFQPKQVIANPEGIFRNKTILIAEDEIINYMYLEEVLSITEAQFIHASNGLEAVRICESNPQIDIVLMDIKMPIMNGHEATALIRKFSPNLPIIAQTAFALSEDIEQAKELGYFAYMTKPVDSKKLLFFINEALKN